MRRKIIKQGTATLTLSLPAKWTKKFSLKAGDEVEVEEKEKELLVTAGKISERKKEITIEITEHNKQDIQALLTHIYRKGFDAILLKNVPNNTMPQVNTAVSLLLGFEITEKEGKQCRIVNISEPTEEKYDALLRRNFLIIKETQSIIQKDIETGKYENIREIEALRKQQDKFILFCKRVLTREQPQAMTNWELLTWLMHIEHAYHYLYHYTMENNVKKTDKIIELLKNAQECFQLFYDAYYKKDINAIHKLNKLKKEYQFGKCYKYLEHAKGKEAVVYCALREILRLIQIGSSPILSGLLEEQITP